MNRGTRHDNCFEQEEDEKKFLTIATDGLSEESEQKRREVDKRKDISG